MLHRMLNRLPSFMLLLILFAISGCTWPVLRALPLIGETYDSPKWDSSVAVSEPGFRLTLEEVLGASFTTGNRITTYVNGDPAFEEMLSAIRSAKDYIYFENYIVWDGALAKEFAAALSERAKAGVRVQVILDWHGSEEIGSEFADALTDEGVQLQFYHPLRWYNPLRWKQIGRLDNRTHRRILVVDGVAAYTGGMGVADQWTGDARKEDEWRDNHYKIEGPAVRFISGVFSENWWAVEQKFSFEQRTELPEVRGASLVQVVRSSPSLAIPAGVITFSAAIESARKTIRIATPYFVPENALLESLLAALKRRVQVEIVVPGENSDSMLVQTASRGFWGELLKAGAEVYEFKPSLYHCKFLVVDDVFVSIGTSNWDSRSLRLNDEIVVNILDPEFAKVHSDIFEADKKQSSLVTYERWAERPFWERIMDSVSGTTRAEL